jgi:DNA repair exonuclease SbcCD ATPase subunit
MKGWSIMANEANDPKNNDVTPEPAEGGTNDTNNDDLAARIAQLEAENEKLKAASRKWEKRSKENAAAAKELETAQNNAQTAEERLAKIEAELNEAKARDARLAAAQEVATKYSMSIDAVLAMSGDTVEELSASADAIKKAIPSYPIIQSGNHPNPAAVTAESIRNIKNPVERVRARAEHRELFNG